MRFRTRGAWLPLLIVLGLASSRAHAVPVDRDSADTKRLNGDWQFRLVDGEKERVTIDEFIKPSFDATGWATIPVPSNWEMQGFEEPRYDSSDPTKVGLYRVAVKIPPEWKDEQVLLQFEGVAFGMTLCVNGKEVGSHDSAFTPVQFDVTPFLLDSEKGAEQLIAVKVTRDHPAAAFDTNDDWALSGIFRDVWLFTVPRVHIADMDVTTTAIDPQARTAQLRVRADIRSCRRAAPTDGRGSRMRLTLVDPDGKTVYDQSHDLPWISADSFPDCDVTIPVSDAKFWTAETPHLYELTMRLSTAGSGDSIVRQRVGLRQITIDEGVLKLNGQRIKLRGVCRHDEWPDVGRAVTEQQWRRDIELIKAGNFNTVRCSHYPPTTRFLELCDEYGLYVLDEVPAGFGEPHLHDPAMQGELLSRAEETVRLDRNHACVIARSIGNENPLVESLNRTGQLVKLLDPTRPIYFAGGDFARRDLRATGAAPFVDLSSKHYPDVAWLNRATTQPLVPGHPLIISEINHALDLGFEAFAERWALVERDDHIAGACIWLFADQGLRRTINAGKVHDSYADIEHLGKSDLSGDVYLDDDTILDSHGQYGSDGIVYADRTPQTDYFQAKAVLAPVKIVQSSVDVAPGPQELSIDVRDLYDFTDLHDLKARWELLIEDRVAQHGELSVECPPHEQRPVKLKLDVPDAVMSRPSTLRVIFTDRRGVDVLDQRVGIVPTNIHDWMTADPHPADISVDDDGKLVVKRDGRTLIQNMSVHVGRQPTMGERRTYAARKLPIWEPRELDRWRLIDRKSSVDGNVTTTRVVVECSSDKSDRIVDAKIDYGIDPRGQVEVKYELSPRQTDGALLEFGLSCEVPGEIDHVRWYGDGPYPALPLKQTLSQFGVYTLPFDDPFFSGTHAHLSIAEVCDKRGPIVKLTSEHDYVAWEPTKDGGSAWRRRPLSRDLRLTHCARVSSPGTKFDQPAIQWPAEKLKNTTGKFKLVF